MTNYTIQPIEISAEILSMLDDFYCGVKAMDDILHSQFLLAELNTDNPRAYIVLNIEKRLVGFLIVGETSIPLEPQNHTHYEDTVDIACLAIHKDFQHQQIGTAILDYVCEKAEEFLPGVEYISVDALHLQDESYSAVPFYEKYGFEKFCLSGVDTIKMVLNLHPYTE